MVKGLQQGPEQMAVLIEVGYLETKVTMVLSTLLPTASYFFPRVVLIKLFIHVLPALLRAKRRR